MLWLEPPVRSSFHVTRSQQQLTLLKPLLGARERAKNFALTVAVKLSEDPRSRPGHPHRHLEWSVARTAWPVYASTEETGQWKTL